MANTPRYNFVTQSPLLDIFKGANTAVGGIALEVAASQKQQQRLKSMASFLGANGLTPDAMVYEQMALAESPDFMTSALTGKATTRDLSMPFDHVLKVLEKNRDRATTLEAAGIRSSGGGVSHRELTDAASILNNEINFDQRIFAANEAELKDLRMDIERIKAGGKSLRGMSVENVGTEMERLEDANTALQEKINRNRETLRTNFNNYWQATGKKNIAPGGTVSADSLGAPTAATPLTKGEKGAQQVLVDPVSGEVLSGKTADTDAPSLLPPPNALAATEKAIGTDAAAKATEAPFTSEGGTAPELSTSTALERPTNLWDLAPNINIYASPSVIESPAAPTAIPVPTKDLTKPPEEPIAAVPKRATTTSELLGIPSNEPEFVGPPIPPGIGPMGPPSPSGIQLSQRAIQANLRARPKPEPLPADASVAAQRAHARAMDKWEIQENLRVRKAGAANQLPHYAVEISKVQSQEELDLAIKKATMMKGIFGFKSPGEAKNAAEAAMAVMPDAGDFSYFIRHDANTDNYGYSMVKKDDADQTQPGWWHIKRGQYAGELFHYDQDGYVVRIENGEPVEFKDPENPNARVTRSKFEGWIIDFDNSPLMGTGEVPVPRGFGTKAARILKAKGVVGDGAATEAAKGVAPKESIYQKQKREAAERAAGGQ